jgi:hypothetical protein
MEGDVLAHLPVTSYQLPVTSYQLAAGTGRGVGGPQHRALFWDGFGGYFRLRGV